MFTMLFFKLLHREASSPKNRRFIDSWDTVRKSRSESIN
jgi:hypothetical protein